MLTVVDARKKRACASYASRASWGNACVFVCWCVGPRDFRRQHSQNHTYMCRFVVDVRRAWCCCSAASSCRFARAWFQSPTNTMKCTKCGILLRLLSLYISVSYVFVHIHINLTINQVKWMSGDSASRAYHINLLVLITILRGLMWWPDDYVIAYEYLTYLN